MSEIFLPFAPRRDDANGHMIVQQNLDALLRVINGLRTIFYVGMCLPYPGDNPSFTGTGLVYADDAQLWAWCNGYNAMVKATFPELYAHLGTAYSVSGPNFKLPDYTNGRSPIGKGASFTTVAATGGEINHTTTIGESAPHSHGWGTIRADIPTRGAGGTTTVNAIPVITDWDGVTRFAPPSTGSTDSQGGGAGHNVMDPYQVAGGYVILTRDPLG